MSASGAPDPNDLELRYPVWTLLDPALPNANFPEGIPQVNVPGIGPSLMVFRDAPMAEQFASKLPRPSVRPLALQYPQQLIDVVSHHQKIGTTHVGVNFAFRVDPDGKSAPHPGRFTTIANFLRLIRTNPDDPAVFPN
jgi:hypothetical protein